MHVTAIIAAAGAGRRVGGPTPKQLLDLGGQSMLARSVAAFDSHPRVTDLVVVVPAELADAAPGAHVGGTAREVKVVAGGPRRQDSVANGFDAVAPRAEIVLIHDAARPFVSSDLIGRTIDGAAAHGAAIAALAAHDTVKRAKTAGGGHVVVETIPRDTIFLAQTPQGFRRDVLAAAIAVGRSGVGATDEAALAERAGYEVHLVAGDAGNVKVTTEEDFAAARRRMEGQVPPGRVGTGYDLHRLVTGRPLVIGGTTIPFDRGPLGHSDGDVVCHAIIDAVLGAASLGDIGVHFPDSDPAWKDASSVELLRRAAAMAAERRFEIVNVDVTVILEQPKLRGHIDRMRASIAGALGIGQERVSIKGKTNEGVDAIGRGEAIAAHAVALLK